jgi:hypothetical protein
VPALPPIRLADDQITAIREHVTAEVNRALADRQEHRDQVLTEAAELIMSVSSARLDEIGEDKIRPSDWERHSEWCDAADVLLAARTTTAQEQQ